MCIFYDITVYLHQNKIDVFKKRLRVAPQRWKTAVADKEMYFQIPAIYKWYYTDLSKIPVSDLIFILRWVHKDPIENGTTSRFSLFSHETNASAEL